MKTPLNSEYGPWDYRETFCYLCKNRRNNNNGKGGLSGPTWTVRDINDKIIFRVHRVCVLEIFKRVHDPEKALQEYKEKLLRAAQSIK